MTTHSRIVNRALAKLPLYWAIDIGGTGIKLGLVDSHGQTLAYKNVPTRETDGPQAAVSRIAELIRQIEIDLDTIGAAERVGLGAPGPMDLPTGYLVAPPQLPSWWDFPIRDAVNQAVGLPVSFLNDANAAAFGEFWLGSGQNHSSMVLLTLGTGVGAGIVIEGELVNGVNSFGGEAGHMIIDPSPDAELCAWGGGRGQLEAYASASGVVRRTQKRLDSGANSTLCEFAQTDDNALTAKEVYLAAAKGDPLALQIVDDTAHWLGIGITTLVHTLDPGSIVLGGAMNFGGPGDEIGDRFLKKTISEFQQRTFENVFQGTTITFATLGSDAGYLGLAGYARKEHLAGQT